MAEPKLLPCPFCGSHDIEVQGKPAILDALDSVYCNECTADAPYPVWNTRAKLPSQGGEAVAWHTEDHLTDKSATTYDPEVADRWRTKGWPVTPLYTHPADQVAEPDADLVRQVTDGGRNPRYEGLFEGESEEQRASRLAGDDDDQAYDIEAERLTYEALGPGAGINPNATSMDDIFLTESTGEVGERAAQCDHQWTDDGLHLLVCTSCGAQEDHDPHWRDMATAPRDGTMVRLLVEFTEHETEDADQAPTIGANNFDNDGEDRWQFAGWCWSHDHFTEGKGEPAGWLPMIEARAALTASAPSHGEQVREIERLKAALEQAHKQVNSECQDWAREYEARRKAVEERELLAGLLREIAVGISKREMPTEQKLNEWFDRIDTALAAAPSAGSQEQGE